MFRTAAILLIATCLPTAAYAAPAPISVDLPAQDMATSLNALAQKAAVQISFPYDIVAGRRSPALKGKFELNEAIRRLVEGTPLIISATRTNEIMLSVDPTSARGDEGTELLVIGTRLTREKAIAQKQAGDIVQDVLGSDELGQLAQKNVGEALNRLPGVSMLVEKGEGRYVQIRGITPALNNVTLNGVPMGSPEAEEGGLASPLDLVSGSILGGAQVAKTRTPATDGQGIGGTVNLQTKMPFDRLESFYGYAVARYGYETLRPSKDGPGGHEPYAIDGLLAGTLADDSIGWLIGGAYENREYATKGIYNDNWTQRGAGSVPQQVKNNYYIIGRERVNANAALQFRPDENSEYFIRGFYAKWNELQHRNRYQIALTNNVVADDEDSGTAGLNAILPNVRPTYVNKSVLSGTIGGSNHLDRLTLDYLVQANRNTYRQHASFWEFASGNIFGPSEYSIDPNGAVAVTFDPSSPDYLDPGLMKLTRLQLQKAALRETTYLGQANLQFEATDNIALKVGGRASRTRRSYDASQVAYGPGKQIMTLDSAPGLNHGGFINAVQPGAAGHVPNIWMDADALDAFFADPANADYFALNASRTFNNEYASDYGILQHVYAGYGMATAQFGPVELIGGVRVENTRNTSTGYLLADGTAHPLEVQGGYTDWLPSLLLNYRPTDSLVFRGGVSKALGRPDFAAFAPISSYSADSNLGSISIGNPDLRSRTSWNYDLSLEWYPNASSALTIALFEKRIKNDLLPVETRYTSQAEIAEVLASHGLQGIVDPLDLTALDVSTTVNGGTSSLRGIEVSGQTQLSMLPSPLDGLGASASATFIEGHSNLDGERIPLLQQPKHVYSLTGYYQKGPWDGSVSYVLNASFLTGRDSANPANNTVQGKFGRIDAKLSYAIRDRLKVFVEATNLNNEATSEFQGNVRQAKEYEYVGRTIYVGVSLGFGGG